MKAMRPSERAKAKAMQAMRSSPVDADEFAGLGPKQPTIAGGSTTGNKEVTAVDDFSGMPVEASGSPASSTNAVSDNITEVDSMVNYTLPPYQNRYKYYNVQIPDDIEGELHVTAKLLFRSFKPSFILEHHPEFINNLPVFEIDSKSATVELQ